MSACVKILGNVYESVSNQLECFRRTKPDQHQHRHQRHNTDAHLLHSKMQQSGLLAVDVISVETVLI